MTNLTIFNQDKANELFNSTEQFPVSFDDAWRWLEYSTKQKGMISFESCEFSESIDFIRFNQKVKSGMVERELSFYSLTIDCFKSWAMMSKTATGKQVRLYFLECEKIAKAKPVAPLTRRQLAEENLRLIIELEESESKLAFAEVQIDVLSEVIDDLFDYSSIIRVAKHNDVNPDCFKWQKLKAASKVLELEIKSAPCAIWKTKNLYHHDAWVFVYPEYNLPEPTSLMLG